MGVQRIREGGGKEEESHKECGPKKPAASTHLTATKKSRRGGETVRGLQKLKNHSRRGDGERSGRKKVLFTNTGLPEQ